jgi:secreted trypsin-like serine protease
MRDDWTHNLSDAASTQQRTHVREVKGNMSYGKNNNKENTTSIINTPSSVVLRAHAHTYETNHCPQGYA